MKIAILTTAKVALLSTICLIALLIGFVMDAQGKPGVTVLVAILLPLVLAAVAKLIKL